jgi:outer membrane protein TolC
VLDGEQAVAARALEAARETLRLMRNQYAAGPVDYLSVATVETSALSSERNALDLVSSRLIASARLIAALGGGWRGLEDEGAGEGAGEAGR